MDDKRIYRFSPGQAEGRAEWRALLGGKGANLAEMANLGIPVPPGFTISTDTCVQFMELGRVPDGLMDEVRECVAWLEAETGKQLGGVERPLLVSVRSGARSSMPGMMDTVLDLGLNRDTLDALAKQSGSTRFALDAYRRLLSMFGGVVLGLPHEAFENALDRARRDYARSHGGRLHESEEAMARAVPDSVLDVPQLREVVRAFEEIIDEHSAQPFPADPYQQLEAAIVAVFESWNTPRARLYREMHGIPHDWGTAVNVQAMVFGNLGESSATGVAFTRDPSTGQRRFFGEWLPNAQGEDVVAGVRTPQPLSRSQLGEGSLEEAQPEAYRQLFEIQALLERHFRDMQDIEFTIEAGKLYVLQTRNGKRTARASVRIAVEMVREGLLSPSEAILRVEPGRLSELLFPTVAPSASAKIVARGIPASPGAVSGRVAFSADDAEGRVANGEQVILVRLETSPEDLHGMRAAKGILTARGGATSHAAVVARGMGRPCVTGCAQLNVRYRDHVMEILGADGTVKEVVTAGEVITIDGATGAVYLGEVPTIGAELGSDLEALLDWSDQVRRLRVRANADTPEQAAQAVHFGAEGIGLCRTEHMFFEEARIRAVREMILATSEDARKAALDTLLPFQTADFAGIFRAMAGRPVTIRLLDPPLHEFLPREPGQVRELAQAMDVPEETVRRRVRELTEQNPMLGHRGVRLAVTYPEIPRMQVRAILGAAVRVRSEGVAVQPEIMVPLVFCAGEIAQMRALIDEEARTINAESPEPVSYKVGTMIELPRAALVAHELAEHAEFFSFGTNDLTQTTLGLSRDDAGSFLPAYVRGHLLAADPFVTLDTVGVGELIRIATSRGGARRRDLHYGLCGEHGGDPASIDFCEDAGLDYVSCSPFRVLIARVAAAHATLRRRERHPHPA